VTFPGAEGRPAVDVEVVRERADAERGLMYRTGLAAEQGMLFVWSDERIRTFWMKNTCIPLDMLFIAGDGTIVGVIEEAPVLNEELLSIPCAASFVLEVNAGFTRHHGVTPGMKAAIHL
jgi:uncharacterized membrane protein (UPF0127 family)